MTVYFDRANSHAPREALRQTFAQVLGTNAAGRRKTEELLSALLGKFAVADYPQDVYDIKVSRTADDEGWDVHSTVNGEAECETVTDEQWASMNGAKWQTWLNECADTIAIESAVSEEISRKYELLDDAQDAWIAAQPGEVTADDWEKLPDTEHWAWVEKVDPKAGK